MGTFSSDEPIDWASVDRLNEAHRALKQATDRIKSLEQRVLDSVDHRNKETARRIRATSLYETTNKQLVFALEALNQCNRCCSPTSGLVNKRIIMQIIGDALDNIRKIKDSAEEEA